MASADPQVMGSDSILTAKLLLALAYEKGIVLNVTKVQKM